MNIPRPFTESSNRNAGNGFGRTETGNGLLVMIASQTHGSRVLADNDPTFVAAYSGNNGANEPMLTCGYDPANDTYVTNSPHPLRFLLTRKH